MSEEKRFCIDMTTPYIVDECVFDYKRDIYLQNGFSEIVELLNSQEEQILDLKAENERLKLQLQTKIIINKQYEEKEKLKKCINQIEKENKILHQRIQILREEIQSTRQILKMQIDKLEGY